MEVQSASVLTIARRGGFENWLLAKYRKSRTVQVKIAGWIFGNAFGGSKASWFHLYANLFCVYGEILP
jgi:hypothetical protein